MKKLTIVFIYFFWGLNLLAQAIINEGFNNGHIPPQGWIFKISGTPYESDANSGAALPALKFSISDQFIITDTFSGATNLSFWAKGNSTDEFSRLIIEFQNPDSNWFALDSISNIKSAQTYEFALPNATCRLKISYKKSAGNVAFDDLNIYKKIIDTIPPDFTNQTPSVSTLADKSASFNLSTNKKAIIRYIIRLEQESAPLRTDFINADSIILTENEIALLTIYNLLPNTSYCIYFAKHGNSNSQIDTSIFKLSFTTKLRQKTLFFSKIYKGTSYNKIIEICNPTNDTVVLENYRIAMSTNGGGWKTSYFNFPSEAFIAPKDVYVIVNLKADSSVIPFKEADLFTSSLLTMTGNDARALQQKTGENSYEIIDIFGNPSSALNFSIAGISDAANKCNLKRKTYFSSGNTDWNSSSGTDSANSEWTLHPLNSYPDIGQHIVWNSSGLFFKSFTIEGQIGESLIDTLQRKIKIKIRNTISTVNLKCQFILNDGLIESVDFSKPINLTEALTFYVKSKDLKDSTQWTLEVTLMKGPQITNAIYKGSYIEVQFDRIIQEHYNSSLGDLKPLIQLKYGTECNTPLPFIAHLDESKTKIIISHAILEEELHSVCLKIDSLFDENDNLTSNYTRQFYPEVDDINAANNQLITLLPNPATEFVMIQGNNKSNLKLSYSIISMEGKILLKHDSYILNNKIDISNLKQGLYYLNINISNTSKHFLFAKKL